MALQIFDISHRFFTKCRKLIFEPGNYEIGNTAKLDAMEKIGWRIRIQRPKTTGFVLV